MPKNYGDMEYQASTRAVFSGTGTVSLPGITFAGDLNTGIYTPGADQIGFTTNGTLRLTINEEGALVIPDVTAPGATTNKLYSVGGALTWNGIDLAAVGGINNIVEDLTPQLGGDLDTNGKFINNVSGDTTVEVDGTFTVSRETASGVVRSASYDSTAANGGRLNLIHNRGSRTTPTANSSGDRLGDILFAGIGGTTAHSGIQIIGTVLGSISDSSFPSQLEFWITPSGSTSAVQRLTIESDGTLNVAGTTDYETLVTLDDDIPNKKYVDDATVSPAGSDNEIQYNNGGVFGADPSFTISGTTTATLSLGDGTSIGTSIIQSKANSNLLIRASGTPTAISRTVSLLGGNGATTFAGGSVTITGGTGGTTSGNGGDVFINGGNNTSGHGGDVFIRPTDGKVNGNGGSVEIEVGAGVGTGNDGAFILSSSNTPAAEMRFEEGSIGNDYVGVRAPDSVATSMTWILPDVAQSTSQVMGIDLGEFTIANLPAAATYPNCWALATDASGGRTIVRSDGTNWKVVAVEGATVA